MDDSEGPTVVDGHAKIVSPLMDCLQMNKKEGKKGSQKRVPWGPEQQTAFDSMNARLCGNLLLQRVNPDKPFSAAHICQWVCCGIQSGTNGG